MPNVAVAKIDKTLSTTPSLPASTRRLLADSFHLGDEIPAWKPPAVTRQDAPGLRRTIGELERCVVPAPKNHIGYWVTLMAKTLAMRKNETLDMALKTAGWITACGDLPADLWTEGCTEILKSNVFFPAPAELLSRVGGKWGERKRMLERARSLLAATGAGPAVVVDEGKPFTPEDRKTMLPMLIKSARFTGRHAQAVKYETELAGLLGRPIEAWATAPTERTTPQERPAQPKQSPLPPHMQASLKAALADKHRAQGNEAYADRLEREVAALGYSRPGREQPPMPDEVPEGVEP